ncbi:HSP20-like chaperone [Neoconidiobolus thromboides FSU 785]|nr:HSP20-like chaperone [Neoconidiobolus thromboides FSU 785]
MSTQYTITDLFDQYSPVELLMLSHLNPEHKKGNKGTHKLQNRSKNIQINLIENENEFQIQALTPGYEKSDISIDYSSTNNSIIIETKVKEAIDSEKENKPKFLVKEFEPSKLHREVKLSSPVNPENISATLELGVLKLTVPKQNVEKVHRISIM